MTGLTCVLTGMRSACGRPRSHTRGLITQRTASARESGRPEEKNPPTKASSWGPRPSHDLPSCETCCEGDLGHLLGKGRTEKLRWQGDATQGGRSHVVLEPSQARHRGDPARLEGDIGAWGLADPWAPFKAQMWQSPRWGKSCQTETAKSNRSPQASFLVTRTDYRLAT